MLSCLTDLLTILDKCFDIQLKVLDLWFGVLLYECLGIKEWSPTFLVVLFFCIDLDSLYYIDVCLYRDTANVSSFIIGEGNDSCPHI